MFPTAAPSGTIKVFPFKSPITLELISNSALVWSLVFSIKLPLFLILILHKPVGYSASIEPFPNNETPLQVAS